MNEHFAPALSDEVWSALESAVGRDAIDTSDEIRTLYSQDIWSRGEKAAFVASPDSIEALSRLACEMNKRGVALNPRGAGMSYTNAYTPSQKNVGIVDFSRLNRIVEINTADMYVTVEAGCSWSDLYAALKAKGVRTPFWGPLSGLTSTVGGGLSQNNAFFGGGVYGTTGDSVLSVTIVLGDGTILRTGTAGTKNGKPFFRNYGPDLTGLFCGDGGALGFKAEITLKLIPSPTHEDWASFEFETRDACAAAMAALMRENKACELVGFDPNLQRVRMQRASLAADAKTLGNVVRKQGSILKGLKEGAKIAFAGRDFIDNAAYSLHFVVEGTSQDGVDHDLSALKEICREHQGKDIENSIPKIIRANPFGPFNNIVGPKGERWVPVHGIVAASDGPAVWAEIDALFDRLADEFEKHDVTTGFLVTNLGATAFLIEPVFLWPEALDMIHKKTVEPDHLAKLKGFEPNADATELVKRARKSVVEIFSNYAAAHFQIGRTYPYKEHRREETWRLLETIKAAVDPNHIINPGALGLTSTDGAQAKQLKARNPRTGEYDYAFESASGAEIENCANALRRAQGTWAALDVKARGEKLLKLASALRNNRDAIANALEIDTGRRRIAQLEVDGAAYAIEGWVAQGPGLAPEEWSQGRSRPEIKHAPHFVPYALAGVISPWNFPLTLSMIDTIPALLAGCAVIVKPSEVTPRFVEPLRAAIAEAGLDDILKFVQGDGAVGAALIDAVDLVCFTGSVATGRKIAAACASNMIPAFLELGGKDPLIITETAPLEAATDAALRGSVLSTGQACQSIERIYVHRSLYDAFRDRLVAKAKDVQLNWPDITQGHIGPIIFEKQAQIMQSHIADAVDKGARLLTGGEIETHGGGFWLRPTILADATHDMTVMQEETFGPVMPLMAFETNEEAIALANDTEYGLSAAVFAGSLDEAESIARHIDAGAVSLNDAALTAQFHEAEKHAFKLSGLGASRMGPAGFQRFLRRKALIANTDAPKPLSDYAE